QPSTGKGVLAAATVPSEPVNVDSVNSGVVQLVGLTSKPWRSIENVSVRTLIGMPAPGTIIGTLLSVAMTWPVLWLTLILARAIVLPRLNGPATLGTTIERPKGAPSKGPVR